MARRKWFLTLSIATNLGVLGAFKYSSFAVDSVGGLFATLGIRRFGLVALAPQLEERRVADFQVRTSRDLG